MLKGKQNRGSKVSLPQFKNGTIQDYMQILYDHQKQSEKAGKYLQAQMAKKKLSEMRTQLEKHRKSEMSERHIEQKREVSAAHLQEMSSFNKYWDQKMIQYEQEAEKLEDEALERHQLQMNDYQKEIQKSLGYKQKQSSQIINLKKIEDNLAKQEKYIQAHQVQKQIYQLQKSQYQKWALNRNAKIKNLLTQLKNKQQNEINALRQRIQQGFEEQKKIRSQQQQKLVQKYLNFAKELENHQHQEIFKFDKASKLQCNLQAKSATINFSRQSSNVSNMSIVSQSRN